MIHGHRNLKLIYRYINATALCYVHIEFGYPWTLSSVKWDCFRGVGLTGQLQAEAVVRMRATLSLFSEYCRKIFRKNSQISNFMKNRPVGVELLHANERTDTHTHTHTHTRTHHTHTPHATPHTNMMNHTFAFSNFVNTHTFCPHSCIYVFCVDLTTNSDYFPIQH